MQRRLDEKNYARTLDVLELPSLIDQFRIFQRFIDEGLNELSMNQPHRASTEICGSFSPAVVLKRLSST